MKPTVKKLLERAKAQAAPAATETKSNPVPARRGPAVREVFDAPHVTTGEVGSSRGYPPRRRRRPPWTTAPATPRSWSARSRNFWTPSTPSTGSTATATA